MKAIPEKGSAIAFDLTDTFLMAKMGSALLIGVVFLLAGRIGSLLDCIDYNDKQPRIAGPALIP